jgi:hypothetical protein
MDTGELNRRIASNHASNQLLGSKKTPLTFASATGEQIRISAKIHSAIFDCHRESPYQFEMSLIDI